MTCLVMCWSGAVTNMAATVLPRIIIPKKLLQTRYVCIAVAVGMVSRGGAVFRFGTAKSLSLDMATSVCDSPYSPSFKTVIYYIVDNNKRNKITNQANNNDSL